MKIKHFIKKDFYTADPYTGISIIKQELLNDRAVVLQEKEKYVGTLTATDVIRRPHNLAIDCLTRKTHISPDYQVCDALKIMSKECTDVLPVYENNKFCGIVYKKDLLNYVTDESVELKEIVDKKTKELQELNSKLEEKIKERTQELERLNSTKDKFFSIIAHDLRSPFSSVLGFSQILKKNSRKFNYDKIEMIAENIHISAQQTFKLLDNLLQWSRSQRGNIKVNPVKIFLNPFINQIFASCNNLAKSKNIKLFNNINDKFKIFTDKDILKIILRNFITNAIKYTKNNGMVRVEADQKNDYCFIKIIDNGIGIKKEKIENLFRIDQNISTLGTNEEEGTGLGLILSDEFSKKINGKILVDSQQDKGSVFTLKIPMDISKSSAEKMSSRQR